MHRVDLDSEDDNMPEPQLATVAATAVSLPAKGVFWDFAVHGIIDTGKLPTVSGNACIVVLAPLGRHAAVAVPVHPGTVAVTVAMPAQTKFPWTQIPVVMVGRSVLSCTLVSGLTWGELGGESGDLMHISTACPAAYVIEVKLREEHFGTGMPVAFHIGIVVAAGRFDKQAWRDAKSAMAGCMVTLATNRGGGNTPGTMYGKMPAGYMFPDVALNDLDTIIYHIPDQPKLFFRGKMQHQHSPVVWIKCRHGPSSKRCRGGGKGPGKSRGKGKGSGKGVYTGKGDSSRGTDNANGKGKGTGCGGGRHDKGGSNGEGDRNNRRGGGKGDRNDSRGGGKGDHNNAGSSSGIS